MSHIFFRLVPISIILNDLELWATVKHYISCVVFFRGLLPRKVHEDKPVLSAQQQKYSFASVEISDVQIIHKLIRTASDL